MKVAKIVTHDQKTFFCQTVGGLKRFLSNYRADEQERVKREFPDKQFLVDHVETVEMTEEEYQNIPATTESARYFRG
jgi:uncharacterized protein YcbK (DUF882 family)